MNLILRCGMDQGEADAALEFGIRYVNHTKVEWRENGRRLAVR
ncbi:hypothetical protein P3T42_000446 [Paraburkholderia sp. GAS38]|jgi:hypothetical protein